MKKSAARLFAVLAFGAVFWSAAAARAAQSSSRLMKSHQKLFFGNHPSSNLKLVTKDSLPGFFLIEVDKQRRQLLLGKGGHTIPDIIDRVRRCRAKFGPKVDRCLKDVNYYLEKLYEVEKSLSELDEKDTTKLKFLARKIRVSRRSDDRLSKVLRMLKVSLEKADVKNSKAWAREARGLLLRLRSLDEWILLEFEWMLWELEVAEKAAEKYPDFARTKSLYDFPGLHGFRDRHIDLHLMHEMSYHDLASKVPILLTERKLTGLAPEYRQNVEVFLAGLENPGRIEALLETALEHKYFNGMLNAYFYRYQKHEKGVFKKLGFAVNNWARRNPDAKGRETVLDLLEVMSPLQGSVEIVSKGRFYKPLITFPDELLKSPVHKTSPGLQALAIEQLSEIRKAGTDKVKKIFDRKNMDCFFQARGISYVFANAGIAGMYPVLNHVLRGSDTKSGRHTHVPYPFQNKDGKNGWILMDSSASSIEEMRQSPTGKKLLSNFCPGKKFAITPDSIVNARCRVHEKKAMMYFERYVYTIGSWVEAEIALPGEVIVNENIPYYGRIKKETAD